MYVRTQISDLLDRQATLQGKKAELEEILKQRSSKGQNEDEKNWEKTGDF